MKIKPRHVVAALGITSAFLTSLTVISSNLIFLAGATCVGYLSQGIFVKCTTGRDAYELLVGVTFAIIAVYTGHLSLQFVARVLFVLNIVVTSFKIMKEKGC